MTKSTPVPIDGRDVILRDKYRAIVAEYSSEIVEILQAVKYDTEADTARLMKCVRDLDNARQQLLNIEVKLSYGPAARPYSDYSYRKLSAAFAGNGLRPYAPVHLDQKWDGTDVEFSWIRRARLDGASWDLAEIPLLETTERYQVKIFSGAQLLRQEEVSQAQWRYSAAMRSADGAHGLLELQVAQLSESFGPGLFRKLRFTA